FVEVEVRRIASGQNLSEIVRPVWIDPKIRPATRRRATEYVARRKLVQVLRDRPDPVFPMSFVHDERIPSPGIQHCGKPPRTRRRLRLRSFSNSGNSRWNAPFAASYAA